MLSHLNIFQFLDMDNSNTLAMRISDLGASTALLIEEC
jgi:hypothetical protein